MKKPLYILKIGGSVVTCKNRLGVSIRRTLLRKIARSIKKVYARKNFSLMLIHGAGAAGHQLAHKYGLKNGTGRSKSKRQGALLSRVANQKLNAAIAEIFIQSGLPVTSCHTASVIIQKNKKIASCDLGITREALDQKYIPLLYGEMVFDKDLGMSICSGDVIASYLADKLEAKKILFASDIDGVFTRDPHIHKDSKLLEKISLRDVEKNADLGDSHNIDVTGGLFGKLKSAKLAKSKTLKSMEIFNGFKSGNYEKVLLGKKFKHTSISE